MIQIAKGRIRVMPGGGISPENILTIAQATGANEFHSSVRTATPSPVQFHKQGLTMGDLPDREYSRFTVCEERVRALVQALSQPDAKCAGVQSY
jgi:copper homeostasis protein